MRRNFGIGFAIGLLLALAACDTKTGTDCDKAGSKYTGPASNHKVLTCVHNPNGTKTWQ